MTKFEKIAELQQIHDNAIRNLANDEQMTIDVFIQSVDALDEFFRRAIDYVEFVYLAKGKPEHPF
ncbi:MAG: hypothetical protein ACK528_01230 [Alphaproteobacteria bacterium]|jgi:hypothetical protein